MFEKIKESINNAKYMHSYRKKEKNKTKIPTYRNPSLAFSNDFILVFIVIVLIGLNIFSFFNKSTTNKIQSKQVSNESSINTPNSSQQVPEQMGDVDITEDEKKEILDIIDELKRTDSPIEGLELIKSKIDNSSNNSINTNTTNNKITQNNSHPQSANNETNNEENSNIKENVINESKDEMVVERNISDDDLNRMGEAYYDDIDYEALAKDKALNLKNAMKNSPNDSSNNGTKSIYNSQTNIMTVNGTQYDVGKEMDDALFDQFIEDLKIDYNKRKDN